MTGRRGGFGCPDAPGNSGRLAFVRNGTKAKRGKHVVENKRWKQAVYFYLEQLRPMVLRRIGKIGKSLGQRHSVSIAVLLVLLAATPPAADGQNRPADERQITSPLAPGRLVPGNDAQAGYPRENQPHESYAAEPYTGTAPQYPRETGNVVAQLARTKLTSATDTLIAAARGNKQAARQMAVEYLVPAIMALLILIVGYMLSSYAGRLVGETMARRVDLTLGKFFGKMAKTALIVLTLSAVAQRFGIDVTSFAAILAAAGFAIGMALQGTLSNFAAGVMLLVFRPFKVGDYIVINGAQGTVDEIELFTTRLNSPDNRHLIVPNSQVFGSTIENVTCNPQRRVEVGVGVEYAADLRDTRHALTTAVSQVIGASSEPPPQVILADLGASSVDWKVRVWCPSADFWAVRERTITAVKDGLDAAGINIPFPQLDLHVIAPARSLSTPNEDRLAPSDRRAA